MEINVCPRWLLAKLGISSDAQPHFAVLLSTVLALLTSPLLVRVPHVCLMHALLGVPCPGCGILHGMAALARLDVGGALSANPASLLLAVLLLFQLLARPLALWCASSRPLILRISSFLGNAALVGLLLVWVHRLFVGGMHGNRFLS
jgi:Protein of unknown function (DUF2752)